MDNVRYGVIGLGNMGATHALNIHSGKIECSVLSAACDMRKERLDWATEKLPGVQLFSDASAMLKSGSIDAAVIAVPHYLHPPLSMEAFSNKVHVMCEKPAGVYAKQVREMNKAAFEAEKDGIVFGIMFNQRTNSHFIKMKEMVSSGELGAIKRNSWLITNWYRPQAYYDSGGWRATWAGEGGGVLLNQCPHNLDLWQWICGMPKKLTAFCHEGKWHSIEVEDDVTAYAEYEDGSTGVFVTSTADAPGDNRFEIAGDKGKLVYEDGALAFYRLQIPERQFNLTNTAPFGAPKAVREAIGTDGSNPQHIGVLKAFTRKILGIGELVAPGIDGLNGLLISNAMHLSSWLGKTVEFPLDDELFYEELQKKVKGSKKKIAVKDIVSEDMWRTQ
jgi:predicted dehydrogenase